MVNFDNIKGTVKADEFGSFKAGELEGIKNSYKVAGGFRVYKRIIRVGDYRKLKEILEKIVRIDVIDVINETERALQGQGYSIVTGAGDDQLASCSIYGMESCASPTTGDTSYSQTCQNTSMGRKRKATTMHQCKKKPRIPNASSQVDHRQEDTLDLIYSLWQHLYTSPSIIQLTVRIISGIIKDNTTNYGTGAPHKTSETSGQDI